MENAQSEVEEKSLSYTFPKEPPTDLRDPTKIAENDWSAFDSLTHMHSHWERPHWDSAHWMITFDDSPQVATLAQECQDGLSKSHLDLIDSNAFHLTVRRMAYWKDVSKSRVSNLFDSAAQQIAEIPEFSIDVFPLAGSTGAIRLSVSPWGPLFSVFDCATTLAGHRKRAAEIFRPHIGVAYNNRTRPAGPVVKEVAKLRSLLPVRCVVQKVDLVTLSRVGHAYQWTTIETVPLSITTDSGPEG
ncbi:hypothetical protein [Umezawaea sp. Da 62-37]|uniref:hypothetical protein n=1 Tax=Umezawaea sp. Da 62-37 TaxID=3075927 RepID=UPI0028F6FA93|nr:hypothetical protein [Umezawaea sp. Da 62-37]WNV83848.1 hypothetical protein RM788_37590 [Umezawaea sp. Da 62-37]